MLLRQRSTARSSSSPWTFATYTLGTERRGCIESFGEVAVVGEQQHSAGVEVEPPDRHQPHADVPDVVDDRGSSLRVAERAHDVLRLVQCDVDERLGLDAAAVHFHARAAGIGARAELGHHPTVDFHATGHDQLLGGASRCNSCAGQYFL